MIMTADYLKHIEYHWDVEHHQAGWLGETLWKAIHQHRKFDRVAMVHDLNKSFIHNWDVGTSSTIDDWHNPYKGANSPILTWNPKKPHKFGHNTYLHNQLAPNDRPYCIAFLPQLPEQNATHHLEIIPPLFQNIPPGFPLHVVLDGWFYSKKTVEWFHDHEVYYTMEAHSDQLLHIWRLMQHGLQYNTWKNFYHYRRQELGTVFYTGGQIKSVMTDWFRPAFCTTA